VNYFENDLRRTESVDRNHILENFVEAPSIFRIEIEELPEARVKSISVFIAGWEVTLSFGSQNLVDLRFHVGDESRRDRIFDDDESVFLKPFVDTTEVLAAYRWDRLFAHIG
jgi:hypothetical protein